MLPTLAPEPSVNPAWEATSKPFTGHSMGRSIMVAWSAPRASVCSRPEKKGLSTSFASGTRKRPEVGAEPRRIFLNLCFDLIRGLVLSSLREKHDEFMLREQQRWSNHKVMVHWLSRFFHYLDRYFISRRSPTPLKEVGLTCFRELIYQEIKGQVKDAAIALTYKEREGEQFDRALLKNFLDIFVEIGLGQMECYENDSEDFLLKDTTEYYSVKAQCWILEDSCPDYMIKSSINDEATDWGIRYEIRAITPPTGIKQAKEMQAEAKRRKHAPTLESEGKKQAQILESEGKKTAQILESQGESEAILAKSDATARGMRLVSEAMTAEGSAKGGDNAQMYPHPPLTIQHMQANDEGEFDQNHHNWDSFGFQGSSVLGLTNELKQLQGWNQDIAYTLCMRPGPHGRLMPLVPAYLPERLDSMNIVVLRNGTTGAVADDAAA